MPNIKCNKCNKYLEDICNSDEELLNFKILLKNRIKYFGGIPYAITPGIQHNEITNNSICNGVFHYKPFDKDPINKKFEISMNKLNNILYENLSYCKNNPKEIYTNKKDKYNIIIIIVVIIIIIMIKL